MDKPIAMLVKDFRMKMGWRQEDLAARLGTDAVVISRWERGLVEPKMPKMLALALERLAIEIV